MNKLRQKRDVVTCALLLLAGCSMMNDFSKFDFKEQDDSPFSASDAGPDAPPGDGDGDGDGDHDGGPHVLPDGGPMVGCDTSDDCDKPFSCVDHACVFIPPPRTPAGIFSSNGGGSAANTRYRLRASFGTPQPFGKARNGKYQLVAGPGAGRP